MSFATPVEIHLFSVSMQRRLNPLRATICLAHAAVSSFKYFLLGLSILWVLICLSGLNSSPMYRPRCHRLPPLHFHPIFNQGLDSQDATVLLFHGYDRGSIRLHGGVFGLPEGERENNEEGHSVCVSLMILREYYQFSPISSVEISF